MWSVNNRSRFKAERAFARDAQGAELWIVAVRATFTIEGDGPNAELRPADEQSEVVRAPEYFGKAGESSLRYDTDLVQAKAGTDVVVHALAHAPRGRPARSVDVGFSVGGIIRKRLRVVGDRTWKKGWRTNAPSDPEPFVALPIRYENAWGGRLTDSDACDPANPIGVGADTTPGLPVPNVETMGQPIESSKAPGTPAGFGPIPCDWQPRLAHAGTYDEQWERTRQPLVPADFNETYFRCAPDDQQLAEFLRGGEEVMLENMTPSGLLSFRLPRVYLGFRTRFDRDAVHHRPTLHTVIIEPEERRLSMVWQSAIPCHHTLYTLKDTLVIEKRSVRDRGRAGVEPEEAFEPELAD
jgi:hypothetical protein